MSVLKYFHLGCGHNKDILNSFSILYLVLIVLKYFSGLLLSSNFSLCLRIEEKLLEREHGIFNKCANSLFLRFSNKKE